MYFEGFVCSKNLAHKMMPRNINNPRILVLAFPFEYQRVENQFISIETVISQEREHLKNMVNRVLTLNPNIVLVEKSVSRIALDLLFKARLSVAMNVKRTAIEAIARCTGAQIISSLGKLSFKFMNDSFEEYGLYSTASIEVTFVGIST